MKKKWYYRFDGLTFIELFQAAPEDLEFAPTGGPFDTAVQAKKDAIARIQYDMEICRKSLKDVRSIKSPNPTFGESGARKTYKQRF